MQVKRHRRHRGPELRPHLRLDARTGDRSDRSRSCFGVRDREWFAPGPLATTDERLHRDGQVLVRTFFPAPGNSRLLESARLFVVAPGSEQRPVLRIRVAYREGFT